MNLLHNFQNILQNTSQVFLESVTLRNELFHIIVREQDHIGVQVSKIDPLQLTTLQTLSGHLFQTEGWIHSRLHSENVDIKDSITMKWVV